MKKTVFVGLIVLATILSGCGKASNLEVKQKHIWYDYGNGMINLSTVSRIDSAMQMTLILTNKNSLGANQEVTIADGTVGQQEVFKIIEAMIEYEGQWVSVKSYAAIKFDNFTLQLQDFDSAGVDVSSEGCVELATLWATEYETLRARLSDM